MGSDGWSRSKVADLIESGTLAVDDGYRVRNVELGPEGIPFVRGGDIGVGTIETRVTDHIRPEYADRVQKKLAKSGDVAFISKGTVGRVGMLRTGQPDVVFSPQVCFWRSLDPGRLNPKFLYYLLRSHEFQANLDAVKTHGSMVADYVSLADQKNFLLTFPPVEVQHAIASILGTLDDKIELNRRMNETLESMARALFKSWFVDFDPVIDNALAAGNPIPEPLSARAETRRALGPQRKPLPKNIQKLFPNAFVFTDEMGWIPDGWEVDSLGNHIDLLTGPAFKSNDFSDDGVRLARGDNVKEGRFQWESKTRFWPAITDELQRYSLCNGDVLIGMDGSKVGKNWVRVGKSDLPCLLVQRVACLRPNGSVGSGYLEVLIGGETFKGYVNNVKTGTSIPHISGGQIKKLPLVAPNDEGQTFRLFEEQIEGSCLQRDAMKSNSIVLAKLRDTLLPKLLSGELRIPEAEKLAAGSL